MSAGTRDGLKERTGPFADSSGTGGYVVDVASSKRLHAPVDEWQRGHAVPSQHFHVSRDALVDRLDLAIEKKLVLITAPAGYGKSTLVSEWADAQSGRRVAWIAVDRARHVHAFAATLCSALESIDHIDRKHLLDLLPSSRRMGTAFMAALLGDWERSGSEVILIFDEFDAIVDTTLAAELGTLISDSPANVHFVLTSRSVPDLPYYKLRLGDQVAEVSQTDLAFTPQQGYAVVCSVMGRQPTNSEYATALLWAEGWVAGFELAASTLRQTADEGGLIDADQCWRENSSEYFQSQLFRHESPASRQFLLETSVLDWMNASLCDAVTAQSQVSESAVRMCARGDLFLIHSETRPGWFKYHDAFRSFLRNELRSSALVSEADLLGRAADWHFAHDEVEVAVGYLIRGRLWARVLDSAQRFGYELHQQGRATTVLNWVDCLPPKFVDGRTEVVLLRTALQAMTGEYFESGSSLRALTHMNSLSLAEVMVTDVIRTWSVHNDPETTEIIAAADRALDAVDAVDASSVPNVMGLTSPQIIRKAMLLNRGIAEMYSEHPMRAQISFDLVLTSPSGFVEGDVAALGQRALLKSRQGRMREARRDSRRALVTAEQSARLRQSGMITVGAHLALARAERAANELESARDRLDGVLVGLQQRQAAAQLAICVTERALVALAMDDPDAGLSLIAKCRASSRYSLPAALDQRLIAAEARLLEATGQIEHALFLLDQYPSAVPEMTDVAVRIAVERGNPSLARHLLENATVPSGNTRMPLEFQLWECILDDIMGDEVSANREMVGVVTRANEDDNIRVFLDASHHALRLLRRMYLATPKPFLRRIVGNTIASAAPGQAKQGDLFEPLSERECRVLGYLPARLSNAEIATQLDISVNTVKTHLKHIYRKLNVDTRREAVVKAEGLFLL